MPRPRPRADRDAGAHARAHADSEAERAAQYRAIIAAEPQLTRAALARARRRLTGVDHASAR